MSAPAFQIIWEPNPGPQTALLACPVPEIFYGGARGGGKTDGALGDWASFQNRFGAHAKGILFRRTYQPELEEVEARCLEIYPMLGASYSPGRKLWRFPNGATLRLRALQRDADAMKYQGHSYQWMCWEEAGNWPSPKPLDKLRATLRSPHGIPTRYLLTGNPGGVGHNWLKARYYDPAPAFTPFHDDEMGTYRVFIPSKLTDTPQLAEKDPDYRKRIIAAAGNDEALLRAWLEGDWLITSGGMVDDLWSGKVHTVEPFEIPAGWYIDRSFDWGSSAPFSVGWWAESNGEKAPNGITYPRGTLFRIYEWYGWNKKPNEGCKMLARDVARGILEREKKLALKVRPGPADPSIWNENQQGQSIAGDMLKEKVSWLRADNSRVHGWEQLRKRLTASLNFEQDPQPGLFVFDTCRQFIRTVPVLPRDPIHRDDVDTDAEDHIGDETRYKCATKRQKFGVKEVLI